MSNLLSLDFRPRHGAMRFTGAFRRAGRIVGIMAAVAQLFSVLLGPLEHWKQNSRLGAHYEEVGGVGGHYAHNEAQCIACAVGHVAAAPSRAPVASDWQVPPSVPTRDEVLQGPSRRLRVQSAPRAPPAAFIVA